MRALQKNSHVLVGCYYEIVEIHGDTAILVDDLDQHHVFFFDGDEEIWYAANNPELTIVATETDD